MVRIPTVGLESRELFAPGRENALAGRDPPPPRRRSWRRHSRPTLSGGVPRTRLALTTPKTTILTKCSGRWPSPEELRNPFLVVVGELTHQESPAARHPLVEVLSRVSRARKRSATYSWLPVTGSVIAKDSHLRPNRSHHPSPLPTIHVVPRIQLRRLV